MKIGEFKLNPETKSDVVNNNSLVDENINENVNVNTSASASAVAALAASISTSNASTSKASSKSNVVQWNSGIDDIGMKIQSTTQNNNNNNNGNSSKRFDGVYKQSTNKTISKQLKAHNFHSMGSSVTSWDDDNNNNNDDKNKKRSLCNIDRVKLPNMGHGRDEGDEDIDRGRVAKHLRDKTLTVKQKKHKKDAPAGVNMFQHKLNEKKKEKSKQ